MNNSYRIYKIKNVIILMVLLCVYTTDTFAARKKRAVVVTKVDSTQIVLTQTRGAPVAPFGDTLFFIHGNIGSFTVEQRALAIQEKIKDLEKYPLFEDDSLDLVAFSDQINIEYNDPKYDKASIILSIDTLQAQIYGRSKLELADVYRGLVTSAIIKRHNENNLQRMAINIGIAIVILFSQYVCFRLIQFGYKKIKVLIRRQRNKKIKGVLGIIDAEREERMIFTMLKFLRFLLLATTLFIAIVSLLKLFPHTISLSDQILSYVISPLSTIWESIIAYLPKFFMILIIVAIFMYIKRFLQSITNRIEEGKIAIKGFYPDWARPTYNIISGILFVFMFIFIFPYLPNSNSQIFQGVSVFLGLVISLGSSNLISNLIAGLVITYMRPFKTGDRVKMDDTVGNVIEKTALVTRVKTAKNEILTIPNSTVMNTKTINYTFSADEYGLILFIPVAVAYDEPWTKVHELLLKAAAKTTNISLKQKPFIMQTAQNDFYAEYQLNVFTKDANKMNDIYSDLRRNVQDTFKEAGMSMLSPHYMMNTVVKNDE
ncbi:MAG: hypothetical protein RL662_1945 [Bacteroidota bacterium]|jgi:small-conductance mechanosensitive channel